MRSSIVSFSAFVLSGILTLGAAVLPSEAAANHRNTSGGGACKPAYGASNKFLFNNNYLENISTTDQYVVCHFQMDDETSYPPVPFYLGVRFTSGALSGTATCVAQHGYYWGALVLSSSQARSLAQSAGQIGIVAFDATSLDRDDASHVLTLNCKVPGSWRLGLIEYWTVD